MTIARLLPFHMHGASRRRWLRCSWRRRSCSASSWPAAIASVLIGVLILAVALATHAGEESTLPVSTHIAFDVCFVVAMALSAVAFAFAGDVAAAAFLGLAALALVALMSLTRYRVPATPRQGRKASPQTYAAISPPHKHGAPSPRGVCSPPRKRPVSLRGVFFWLQLFARLGVASAVSDGPRRSAPA